MEILLDSVTWIQIGQLLVLTTIPATAVLIGYLTYIRGHFESQREERKLKREEQDANREAFIKMAVRDVVAVQMAEIHQMIENINHRIDELFKLLRK